MASTLLFVLTILLDVLAIVAIVFFLFWKFWFCREPERAIPNDAKAIISPANGTVAVVRRYAGKVVAEKWNGARVELDCADVASTGWFVLIVMTPMNVHVQRSPIDGIVLTTRHTPGRFLNAVKKPERLLTLHNERNEILIEGKHGNVKVIQIAGLLARRINCYVSNRERVARGARIGFINLGSQVALVLPHNVKIKVKPGEVVVDGETIIGSYA